MKDKWRSALGIVLSVVLLAWTLRGVSISQVWENIRVSNIPLFIASAVASTLIFPLRARRWRNILAPIAPNLPFGQLWRATAIGMMVNNVVPARAGEPARAYALARETPRVGFSSAFASLAVDRIFDAVVVLLLMLAAMLSPSFPEAQTIAGQPLSRWVGGGMIVLVVSIIGVYAIVFFPGPLIRSYEAFARRVAPRFEARGRDALVSFTAGLGVLRRPSQFAGVFGWTLAHWLLDAFAYWLAFRAVGITAPYSAALFLQGLIAIGVAIPSSPGFFGVFEALAKAGLAVYGVPPTLAVSWAIGFHILSFIPITIIGAYYFVRMGLHFRELQAARADAAPLGAADAPLPSRDAR